MTRVLIAALAAMLAFAALIAPATADSWSRDRPHRRFVEPPYRTQLTDSIYARSDCGPAVLAMALATYGIDVETLTLRELTHTYQGTWPRVRVGTALQHIAHVAEDFGLVSYGLYGAAEEFREWPVDELVEHVRAGRLAVPLVRYGSLPGHESSGVRWGHYILLYALDGDGFRYHDPAFRPIEDGRARWISFAQLERAMAPVWPPRQALALG